MKIQKKNFFFLGGVSGRGSRVQGGGGWGGQGGCERRIEAFVKIKKKIRGWGGRVWGGGQGVRWRVRVDVNIEVKFL